VVFYELLTGRRPFRGDSHREVMEQITNVEPRPPRQVNDTISKELERICLKSLSKKAIERYSTAKDMAEDLRACLGVESGSLLSNSIETASKAFYVASISDGVMTAKVKRESGLWPLLRRAIGDWQLPRQASHLPVLNFTLLNRTGHSVLITKLKLSVIAYSPYASVPETRELEVMTVWDITLPYHAGKVEYIPPSPILVANDDAAMIGLRFSCDDKGSHLHPRQVADYLIKVAFVSDTGAEAVSEELHL
jgi:serine/threonine protein kinase